MTLETEVAALSAQTALLSTAVSTLSQTAATILGIEAAVDSANESKNQASTSANASATSASNSAASATAASASAIAAAASASTAASATAFLDTNPVVKGSSDATKQIRFEVDGLTTATTRVLTVQDKDGVVAVVSDIPAQLPGFRNRIINGDMRIDQRNNVSAVVLNGSASFHPDRFQAYSSLSSKLSVQRVADAPAGFTYSTKITVLSQVTSPANTDNHTYRQIIEGHNIVDMGFGSATAQQITYSFWVKGSVPGTYAAHFVNGTRSYVVTFPVTTSWARQQLTITADTTGTWAADNTPGLYVGFELGCGSNFVTTPGIWQSGTYFRTSATVALISQTTGAFLNITGVQLEPGAVATSFEQRPYGLELSLCQRYYYRLSGAAAPKPISVASYNTTTNAQCNLYMPVPMRVVPAALEQSGTPGHYDLSGIACTTVPTLVGTVSESALNINFTVGTASTIGFSSIARIINAAGYLGVSAEL